jgi:short-subunit dehydrogenase
MKIAILGASRGLGAELSKALQKQQPESHLLLVSRKLDLLNRLARAQDATVSADFSTQQGAEQALLALKKYQPNVIYYTAGGGPYGQFGDKSWADHSWAINVTFLTPAKLLHWAFSDKPDYLKQFIVVGSAVAESAPDPGAASYCAAKHALRGLVETLKQENPQFNLILFSPGYMATDMLPANSRPRIQGEARKPKEVAKELIKLTLE